MSIANVLLLEHMKLSQIERIILINQYKILNALKVETCDAELSALRGNFELALDWVFQPVSEKSVSLEDCQEVESILKMFSYLRASHDRLPDKSEKANINIVFSGFDGATEADQYAFAHYLFEHDKRFTDIKPAHLNSGVPFLPRYRKMLQAFVKYRNVYHSRGKPWLLIGEICDVLDAFNPGQTVA
jgi:uncharacterized protein YfbU (UPF0304 family)